MPPVASQNREPARRGFAAAGRADEGRHLALAGCEAHVAEHILAAAVSKADVVEHDVIVFRLKVLCPLLDGLFEYSAHALNLQLCAESGRDVLEDGAERVIESRRGEKEAEKIKEADIPGEHERRAGEHRGRKPRSQESLGRADEFRAYAPALHGGQLFVELGHVPLLSGTGFYIAYGLEPLLYAVRDGALVEYAAAAESVLYAL